MRTLGDGIFNISGINLTQHKLKVLDKGLKFATKKNLSKFDAYVDIQKCTQRLNIKKYMLSKPGEPPINRAIESNTIMHIALRNKSLFIPPRGNEGHVDAFKKT